MQNSIGGRRFIAQPTFAKDKKLLGLDIKNISNNVLNCRTTICKIISRAKVYEQLKLIENKSFSRLKHKFEGS